MNTSRIAGNNKQLPYDPNRLLPDDTNILVLDEDGNLSRRSTDSFPISTINRRQQYSNNEMFDDDRAETSVRSTVRQSEPYLETSPVANNLVAGILDAETVAKHVSKIGKTAEASTIAYLTLTLPVSKQKSLSTISLDSFPRVMAYVIYPFSVITLIYNELNYHIIIFRV